MTITLVYLFLPLVEKLAADNMKWVNVHAVDFVTSCISNRSPENFVDNCMEGAGKKGGNGIIWEGG